MTEELYAQINDEWYQLDLNSPSDITLEFKSSLFEDLSKITASHSYTIKIPRSINNRRIMDMAEDPRTRSSIAHQKLPARFIQNGVNLFKDAYLYLTATEDECYSVVLTWNVNKAFGKLTQKDLSLRELPGSTYEYEEENGEIEKDDVVRIDNNFTLPEDYDPHSQIVKTLHNPGASVSGPAGEGAFKRVTRDSDVGGEVELYRLRHKDYTPEKHRYFKATPPPVMPVPYLVDKINEYFGTNFDFGNLFDNMVVPLVRKEESEGLARQNTARLRVPSKRVVGISTNNWVDLAFYKTDIITKNAIWANIINVSGAREIIMSPDPNLSNVLLIEGSGDHNPYKVILDGTIRGILAKGREIDAIEENAPHISVQLGITKTAQGEEETEWEEVYDLNPDDGHIELAGYDSYGRPLLNAWIDYNFTHAEGHDYIEIDSWEKTTKLRFTLKNADGEEIPWMDRFEDYTMDIAIFKKFTEESVNYVTNVFRNLPDISCSDFIKNLCWIAGGFPAIDIEGNLFLKKYNDIRDNLKNNDCLDWSGKVLISSEKTDFDKIDMVSTKIMQSLAQRNYYLMKNDNITDTGREEKNHFGEEWYRHSYGKILVNNETLLPYTTIYTSPFYGAFLENSKRYRTRTFENQGYFKTEDGWKYTAGEAKPVIAYIKTRPCAVFFNDFGIIRKLDDPKYFLDIDVWQFAPDMTEDINYGYMAKVMSDTRIVTLDMMLTEFDLASLDYSRPIYIDLYNSYFVPVDIKRGQDGVCECEMLRVKPEAKAEDYTEKIKLIVRTDNPTIGSVTGSGEYEAGSDITIEALPSEGYAFSTWRLTAEGVAAPRYIRANPYVIENLQKETTATAIFVKLV